MRHSLQINLVVGQSVACNQSAVMRSVAWIRPA
jgi:hypothetical protein